MLGMKTWQMTSSSKKSARYGMTDEQPLTRKPKSNISVCKNFQGRNLLWQKPVVGIGSYQS